ncbi:cytochrome b/b6 domain-containing protein [Microbacterium sp. RU33B]|uniref:cytochrome b/b6 domain-containing protein n=1 Tax=Microbacterium sp. RU33B TaxID=1907390 RepID=UPI002116444B|nr:cytochrome b/b6 domain-containing protein [Microbacterium sp. RU33B]
MAAPVAEPAAPVAEPAAPVAEPAAPVAEQAVPVAEAPVPVVESSVPIAEPGLPVAEPVEASSTAAPVATRTVRRGLPRVPGGEPWPPASAAPAPVSAAPVAAAAVAADTAAPTDEPVPAPVSAAPARAASVAAPSSTTPLRRGLPRVAGGEPWPPAGFAPDPAAVAPVAAAEADVPIETTAASDTLESSASESSAPAPAAASVAVASGPRAPLPFTRTVWQGPAARRFETERRAGEKIAAPEPERIGPFTKVQWAGAVAVGGLGLLFAAFMAVVTVRFLLSTEPLRDFLETYPGEYHLPEGAPVGFPAWLGWQHFFNVFLMVLIIRSGLQVRTEKRPTAFWTPRNNPKGKISLALWFHQSLDILWLVNGVIFIVLLFTTGQWMRVVPTSWEVFPNALSAVLQYISLDWPTENGWVNYNSVQQLAYFVTIFIAAPVAAITGARMTKLWPQNAKTLNRIYPVEWARAVHFPTMIYFCLFIFVHVVLVFATGALRNLNHMYAAQGSVDPNAYADNWTGFWLFFASMVVIASAWIAARPLVLAPIARLFGTVSGR